MEAAVAEVISVIGDNLSSAVIKQLISNGVTANEVVEAYFDNTIEALVLEVMALYAVATARSGLSVDGEEGCRCAITAMGCIWCGNFW